MVVDFGALGGGVQTACMAGGAGQSASSLFTGAGFDLSYVQNQPGFVCRINQRPAPADQACVNTPPEDAYWGLWWSDGTSGSWVYSNYGVGSLKVPDGGYVGFAWQTGSQNARRTSARNHTSPRPAPRRARRPPPGGGGGGHGNGGGGHGSAADGGRPPDGPSRPPSRPPIRRPPRPLRPRRRRPRPAAWRPPRPVRTRRTSRPAPTATPTVAPSDGALPTASDSTSAAATPSESARLLRRPRTRAPTTPAGALPAWAVPLVLLALAAGGGATYLLRRRHRTSP